MLDDHLEEMRRRYGDQITAKFHEDMLAEVMGAREKFPGSNPNFAALIEEVGELAKDLLQQSYEPHKGKTAAHVYREAVQVAAMALRVACEGDPTFPAYKPIEAFYEPFSPTGGVNGRT